MMLLPRLSFLAALALAAAPAASAHRSSETTVSAPVRAVAAEQTAAPEGALSLEPGAARFWLGGMIDRGDVRDPALCDVVGPCPAWDLRVPAGGHRLRVAIDTPSREDDFELRVTGPDGATATASASNQFNAEAFVAKPAAGTYHVQVVPTGATRAFFRLRAKLEQAPAPRSGPPVRLLPNLRAVPPYELGFVAPANPLNGVYPPDDVNPPLSVAGAEPLSCAPDEAAPVELGGQGAHDCLRLTSGPINAGDGPFIKRFTFAGDLVSGRGDAATLRGPAEQVIVRSDGTTERRAAGTYLFHTTHAHFHDEGILTYELLRVTEDGRGLVAAGAGTKSGFCPADQLMGRWRSFTQDPAGDFGEGDTAAGSCFDPQDGTLALTRGWGDVYRWQRPGQFVEFAGNTDGLYVVRTIVDKGDVTLETDETDNISYALARVTGRRVEVLERGHGESHLDPDKEVFTGFGPASQDGFAGALPAAGGTPSLGRDARAPRVRGVRLVRRGGRRLVRFTLDEAATVKLTVRRGTKRLYVRSLHARKGTTTVTLPRRLARARGLRIGLVARDAAGNFSRVARL